MNKWIGIGNLVRDPETATTNSGVQICKFTIAVNRRFANADGEREADYINIVTWRGLAENCGKYCTKGMNVAVCGSLQVSSYTDKNGEKRYRTDVVADEVEFLSKSGNEAAEGQQAAQAPKKKTLSELQPTNDDGLPF